MKAKLFTLRFHPDHGFDTSEVDAFFEVHDALSVSTHFMEHGGAPWCALTVTYRASELGERASRARTSKRRGPDPRAELDPAQQSLYDSLRAWRSHRSRDEGVPPYMVASNRQLADIVRQAPTTLAGLEAIAGLGDGKRKRHGAALLEALAKLTSPAAGSAAGSSDSASPAEQPSSGSGQPEAG